MTTRLLRTVLPVALAAAALLSAAPAGARLETGTASIDRQPALEDSVLDALNALRARKGLGRVSSASGLVKAALAHARQLAKQGIFQHESADGTSFDKRIKRYWSSKGYSYWSVGENLVFASGTLDAERAIELWYDSPGHRKNMLHKEWKKVGIAAVFARNAGGVYEGYDVTIIVNDFGVRR